MSLFEREIAALEQTRQSRLNVRDAALAAAQEAAQKHVHHLHMAEVIEGEVKGIDIALGAFRRASQAEQSSIAGEKIEPRALRGQVELAVLAAMAAPVTFDDLVTITGHNPSSIKSALNRLRQVGKIIADDGHYCTVENNAHDAHEAAQDQESQTSAHDGG